MMKKLTLTMMVALLSACSAIPSSEPDDALARERQENLRLSSGNTRSEVFYKRGKLADGQSKDYTVHLTAGQRYAIYSDCKENACQNLDMDLLLNGQVIDSDTESDTYPLFAFMPQTSGKYTIRTKMTKCVATRCEYHAQVVRVHE